MNSITSLWKSLAKFFSSTDSFERRAMENFLAQSTDVADLEARMRRWDQQRAQRGSLGLHTR